MTKQTRSYYEWKLHTLLYKTSGVECDCSWGSFYDCEPRGCSRAVAVKRDYKRIEEARAKELMVRVEDNNEEIPPFVTVLQGDTLSGKAWVLDNNAQSVVIELDPEVTTDGAQALAEQWRNELPDVHLVLIQSESFTVKKVIHGDK